MKKWITALSAATLALSVALLTACSAVSSDGTISGSYRDAEDADIQQLLTSLSDGSDRLFGDRSADGWRYGLHADASMDCSLEQDASASSFGIGADLGILFTAGESGTDLAVGGSLDISSEVAADGKQQSALDIGIHPYIDDSYIYFNVAGTAAAPSGESSVEQRGKISRSVFGIDIFDLDAIPDLIQTLFEGTDVASFWASLDESGVDMDVDTSSGFKARFTFSTEGIADVIKETLGSISYVDTSGYTVNVASDTLEMYLMLDAEGAFSALTFRSDIAVTVPEPGFDYNNMTIVPEAGTLSLRMGGMFALTSDDADIVFPSDLSEYPEVDLSELLPTLSM